MTDIQLHGHKLNPSAATGVYHSDTAADNTELAKIMNEGIETFKHGLRERTVTQPFVSISQDYQSANKAPIAQMTTTPVDLSQIYAMHHNPPGVKVSYEGSEGNLAYVAGYLGFENTEDLKTFVTKAMTDGPLERFMASRKVKFGLIKSKNPSVTRNNLMMLIRPLRQST